MFKFIPSSYIKNLLEIVVKLKIKKCCPDSSLLAALSMTELRTCSLIKKLQKYKCSFTFLNQSPDDGV